MRQQFLVIIIAVTLLLSCHLADTTPRVEPAFQRAAPSDRYTTPQFHTLIFDGKVVAIIWNNNVASLPKDNQWEILDLTIEENYHIERLWYTKFNNDLIIVYETSNFDYSGSYIARIDMSKKISIWITPIGAFNLGEPAFRDQYMYMTSIGFAAKLDLRTGEYVWKHGGLYNQQTQDFNSFQRPVFNGDRVVFQGNNPTSDVSKRIEVKDSTGEVVGIFTTDTSSNKPLATATLSSTACSAIHLGTGKNLAVKLQKGCYYHFELPCSECQAGEKDIIAIHYTGNEFGVVIPEGSAWEYNEESSLRKNVCQEIHIRDHFPNQLPWFLILPSVEQLAPCG
jgi:hypothetical protein